MTDIAIVEDDRASAELLGSFLTRFAEAHPKEKIHYDIYERGGKFLTSFKNKDYGILLLDINLPDIDGMTIAQEVRKTNGKVVIVFVTDMTQFAVRGYSVDALDYIVKPVSFLDFSRVLARALTRVVRTGPGVVTIHTSDGILRQPIDEIEYVEIINHTLIYHLKDRTVEAYGAMRDLEVQLSPLGFVQISRYYLVNLRCVRQLKDLTLRIGNTELQISVRKRKEVLTRIAELFGD